MNGETGDVVIDPPPLATSTQSGLISAPLFALITGQNATNGQVLQFTGGTPTWGNLTVSATPVQWQKLTANATLETDKRYFVKGGLEFTLPATVSGSIEISNQTTTTVTIIAAGTARINGIATDNLVEISQQERVKIKPGKSAKLIADGGNWESQDCDNSFLRFTYNGSPLTPNLENPEGAGDLFEFLGIQAAKNTVNRWVNPAGTSQLLSVASAMEFGAVANFTDRISSGQNIYTPNSPGSWIGWQFAKPFRCTGFVIQTRAINSHYPRSFSIRVNTGTTLTSAANPANWEVAGSWANQTQLNQADQYSGLFSTQNPLTRNQLVLRLDGADSSGMSYLCFQEIFLFGDYFS